ncbi:hypothetical protein [Bacillus marinisedimentorum]|uniref:hypothetical protein n=1 Tax=Bacillus marinisedimentorum TaxID=1821260 RepID=UPI0007DF10D8|nr:hypothetical protein [Bacillus marinisedimentorum]
MTELAEALRAIAITILVISSSFYFRHLDKTRKQRKLSTFEFVMYVTIQIAFILFTVSLLLYIFVV